MATVKVDKSNFQAEVLNASEPVVVDFWAVWCGPCKMIAPSLEEISNELAGKVKIAKLNIDENPELAAQFGVHPTQIGQWKRQLLEGVTELFSGEGRRKVENQDALIAELFEQIGRLQMEAAWLKKQVARLD